ncbi:MAG: glycoside hydrolase family 2 TIM barrel-domain containing protein [Thermoleophilaceae bacterium]
MRRSRIVAAAAALATLAAPGAALAAPDLDGVSGPDALAEVDLAGRWTFEPAGGRPTTIEVPGGGWVKQGHRTVKRAVYRRTITVPDVAENQVTVLDLGAVNHRATVFVDGRRVGTQTTSFTSQSHELSGRVRPGGTHELAIEVLGREALIADDGRPATPTLPGVPTGALGAGYLVPDGGSWSEGIAQGIFRSARLRVYPAVHIAGAFVRTSVERDELEYDVWIRNGSSSPQAVELTGALTGGGFAYPSLPSRTVTVPAGSTAKVTIGPVAWGLGRESWWWPNVPYRRGYRAQLHDLRLQAGGSRARYRFGFREFRQVGTTYELNGVRVNHRGDSLTGAIFDRIDHGGQGDAFHTFPGFLPPGEGNPGWPQAVDNYQRLNYNVVRIHQVPASPYMLDVADEMGLMLISESAIRGSESKQDFKAGRENMLAHMRDLVVAERNHPAVVRWSQSNEPDANGRGEPPSFQRDLYDVVMAADGTRPVSVDVTSQTYEDMPDGNFSVYQHYVNADGTIGGWTDDVHPRDDRPFGRGEFIWPLNNTPQGFMWFATTVEKMREKDASDVRPYSLAGAWGSAIPGVRRTSYLADNNLPPLYGEDNLPDPWSNEQVRRNQHAFHPVLVADAGYWEEQKLSGPLGRWPATPGVLRAGAQVSRELVVFNDTFSGRQVDVSWELRLGSGDGLVLDEGGFTAAVPLGECVRREIDFTAPAAGDRAFLVLSASKPGHGELFREEDQWFVVAP